MVADKDSYLVAPEEILEAAAHLAKIAEETAGWVADYNNVANNNLDKNLTTNAHNSFNSLWGMWYQRLLDLAQAFAALAIVMEKGVVGFLREDKEAAQAMSDDPNIAAEIDRDIKDIEKEIDTYQKTIDAKDTPPSSPSPNNEPPGGKQPEENKA